MAKKYATFLAHSAILMAPYEDTISSDANGYKYEFKLNYPPVCCGCMESTTYLANQQFTISLESSAGATGHSHKYLEYTPPLRLCNLCHEYNFTKLIRIRTYDEIHEHIVDQVAEILGLEFRFPNIAYYPLFLQSNPSIFFSLKPYSMMPGTGSPLTRKEDYKGTNGLTSLWISEFENFSCIQDWRLVEKRWGLHQYLRITGDILKLNRKYGWWSRKKKVDEIRESFRTIEQDYNLTADDLFKIRSIMYYRVPIFKVLESDA